MHTDFHVTSQIERFWLYIMVQTTVGLLHCHSVLSKILLQPARRTVPLNLPLLRWLSSRGNYNWNTLQYGDHVPHLSSSAWHPLLPNLLCTVFYLCFYTVKFCYWSDNYFRNKSTKVYKNVNRNITLLVQLK